MSATEGKFPEYDAGFEARGRGVDIADNPYPPDSEQARDWFEGWKDLDEHLEAREAVLPGWSNV